MLLLTTVVLVCAAPEPPVTPSPRVDALLEKIRMAHKVPGMVGAVVKGDRIVAAGAAGLRKTGGSEKVTLNDRFHLGSNTKAMTATLIGLLVDDGRLNWSTTVASLFPELAPKLHADYRTLTLDHLLTHRGGLPANMNYAFLTGGSASEKRGALVADVLARKPGHPPGTHYEYSNVGYIIAGAIAEKITSRSWEDLMRERLFGPLGMTAAGFGPPGTPGQVDQPWGHLSLGPLLLPRQGDNPEVLGPAGRVHAPLADWARFASFHLNGKSPGTLSLRPDTLKHLHTPPQGEDYACGWVARAVPWSNDDRAVWHNGSNTMWYAEMWVVPRRGYAVLVAANDGRPSATKACDEAAEALVKAFRDELTVDSIR